MKPVKRSDENVEILLIDDVARHLRMSVRTIERRIRVGTFPIPELPRLDHRRRWSKAAVDQWVATAKQNSIRVVELVGRRARA